MKKIILLLLCLCTYVSNAQERQMPHYLKFARTYGIVRYFSPNPYTEDWSESDWMKVCAFLVNRAETQPLDTVFKTLAPTLSFSNTPIVSKGDNNIFPNELASYYYYKGSGEIPPISFLAKLFSPELRKYKPYYKKLINTSELQDSVVVPVPYKYYSYLISNNKYLNIQHALPKSMFNKKETKRLLSDAKYFWKHHKSNDETLPKRRSFIFGLLSDKSVRIADLIVRWNIIRHFYPYYEDDNLNWNQQLENYLLKAIQLKKIDSFNSVINWYNTICKFLNPVKDGHIVIHRDIDISDISFLSTSTYLPEYYADVETQFVNDTLLIRKQIGEDKSWRILNTINNKPAINCFQNCKSITNAATEGYQNTIAKYKLFSSAEYGTPFTIQSSDMSGQMITDTIYAKNPNFKIDNTGNPAIKKYDNGILYINGMSDKLNEKSFLSAITPDIKKICIDLRGRPYNEFEDILAHLILSEIKSPTFEKPINCFPFQKEVYWEHSVDTLKPKQPYINLPIIFLCDSRTISWGETILMLVNHYKLGEIIGQNTAGTNGDVTQFNLPMFGFYMTGMRMRCMNGDPHHGIGIIPDIPVKIYAQDYISNYDRILSVALNTIKWD